MPAGLATDQIYIRAGSWQSNVVQAEVQPGQNVANVSGSIAGIYPASNPGTPPFQIPLSPYPLGLSVALEAVAFSVSFQILPSAQPFTVAAVGEAGYSLITIDPVQGTYRILATEPTQATRLGDFSQPQFPAFYNWNSCRPDTALCDPLPANIIPASLLDPAQVQAQNWLPLPNTPVAQSFTALFQTMGTAVAGSTFTIDTSDTTSSTFGLGIFGGWLRLPWGPFATHDSRLELFVDGQSIASTTVTYSLVHRE